MWSCGRAIPKTNPGENREGEGGGGVKTTSSARTRAGSGSATRENWIDEIKVTLAPVAIFILNFTSTRVQPSLRS